MEGTQYTTCVLGALSVQLMKIIMMGILIIGGAADPSKDLSSKNSAFSGAEGSQYVHELGHYMTGCVKTCFLRDRGNLMSLSHGHNVLVAGRGIDIVQAAFKRFCAAAS